jgi:hypothetical protein
MPREKLPKRESPYSTRVTPEGWIFVDPVPQGGLGTRGILHCPHCAKGGILVPWKFVARRTFDRKRDEAISKGFAKLIDDPVESSRVSVRVLQCPRCANGLQVLEHPSIEY